MKNPEDYLEIFIKEPNFDEVSELIEQAQKDAYNEAIDDAVKNVDLIEITGDIAAHNESPSIENDMGDVWTIDKQSILKLKK